MFVWNETSARCLVHEAAGRFARHEAIVLHLRTGGDMVAVETAVLELQDLQLHLLYSEAVLVAVRARLSRSCRTGTAKESPSVQA